MSEEGNKEQTRAAKQDETPELTDDQLEEIAGGPNIRLERVGLDHIGYYNFGVEIEGVTVAASPDDGSPQTDKKKSF